MSPAERRAVPPRARRRPDPEIDRIPVVYIVGWGRSGTTLLARTLNTVTDAVDLGELFYVWSRGIQQDQVCECGLRFSSCPFWQGVCARLPARIVDGVDQWSTAGYELRTRHVFASFSTTARDAWSRRIAPYLDACAEVYAAAHAEADYQVLIDASKNPGHAYALSLTDRIDLRLIHVVRDPRATAFSWWRRVKSEPGDADDMGQHHPLRNAMKWRQWNAAIERMTRSLDVPSRLVRYEDFVRSPERTTRDLCAWAGIPGWSADALEGDGIRFAAGHHFAGNPNRVEGGRVPFVTDDSWRAGLAPVWKSSVSLLTRRGLRHYGYPV